MSSSKQLFAFLGWLLACFLAAAIGAMGSLDAPDFYRQLALPTWAPPPSLFGPVWTVLYFLMAVAAWLVWRQSGFRGASRPLALFMVQLVLNALWSWIFFHWRQGGLAFAEIMVLGLAVLATIMAFWRHSKLAAGLLVPYLAWVTFAAYLNYTLWQSNPQLLG